MSVSQTGRVAYSTQAWEGSHRQYLLFGAVTVKVFFFSISILIQWLVLVSVLNLSRLATVFVRAFTCVCVCVYIWKRESARMTVSGCWSSATVMLLHLTVPHFLSKLCSPSPQSITSSRSHFPMGGKGDIPSVRRMISFFPFIERNMTIQTHTHTHTHTQ